MADIAMDGIELEETGKRKVLGIFNIKEIGKKLKGTIEDIKTGIETRVDESRTRRAEKKYERVRDKLLYAGTNYTKKQYDIYAKFVEETKNMTPVERRRHLENVMKGKNKAATKAVRGAVISGLWGLGDAACVMATTTAEAVGQGILNTVLSTFGVAAFPWGTIATFTVAAAGFVFSMHKLKKSMNFLKSEQTLSNKDFIEEFEKLARDLQTLKNTLEQSRDEWVQKAKTMKTKEYKEAYAAFVEETVKKLGLDTIDILAIQEVFGKGKKPAEKQEAAVEDAAEVDSEEEKEEDKKEGDTPVELTEDQKKQQEEQRRLAEEQRLREEEERKKQEDTNAVEEERE